MTSTDPRFELDYSGLASLVFEHCVANDHDAMLAIEAALPGVSDHPHGPLISTSLTRKIGLAIHGSFRSDAGWMMIRYPSISPSPSASRSTAIAEQWDDPPDPGDLYDTAEIIENAVKTANELLEWSER